MASQPHLGGLAAKSRTPAPGEVEARTEMLGTQQLPLSWGWVPGGRGEGASVRKEGGQSMMQAEPKQGPGWQLGFSSGPWRAAFSGHHIVLDLYPGLRSSAGGPGCLRVEAEAESPDIRARKGCSCNDSFILWAICCRHWDTELRRIQLRPPFLRSERSRQRVVSRGRDGVREGLTWG